LLIHYSKLFRAALTGETSEAKGKTVELEEDDPDFFKMFIHWLYYQRFLSKDAGDDEDIMALWSDQNATPMRTDQCGFLHAFGDKYEIEKLGLDTVNELVRIALLRLDSTGVSVSDSGSISRPSPEFTDVPINHQLALPSH
jgi:hypothetical protein